MGSSSQEEAGGILRKERKKEKYKKRVRYYDLMPGDVMLPTPAPVITHTSSDKEIFKVILSINIIHYVFVHIA